ncbi:MAG TPA: Hsp20/alpha crystallin family protein [Solirubrobacterales bacterium]|jgi:HSP20 family protein
MAATLTPASPFAELGELRERIDRAFGDLFQDLTDGGRRTWRLSVDVVEEDDRYVVLADAPGMGPDDVTIEVKDNVLTVSGEHSESEEEKKRNYVRRERRWGAFSRSMTLPPGVDADDVKATFEDGVLEISIPKPKVEEPETKRIEISRKSGS